MNNIRSQFFGLSDDIAYLDNASTTQMLRSAHEVMVAYWDGGRANVGRGLYPLTERSMQMLVRARKTVADFVDADPEATIFTKSTTEGLNTVAIGLRSMLKMGDEILVSPFEHHANLLPWRRLARETGARVRTMPMTADFMLDVAGAMTMISDRTKILTMTVVSNVTGTVLPVKKMIAATPHAMHVLDAAQAAPHGQISLRDFGADAIAFGSHKCYGPAGVGALALSQRFISFLEPMIIGGGMVERVLNNEETWLGAPMKFEGGSMNVEGALGFAAAVQWTQEQSCFYGGGDRAGLALRQKLIDGLRVLDGVTVFDPPDAIAIVSFTVNGVHPHDLADLLGKQGICVRAGNHCAQPLMDTIAPNGGTVRVSLAAYTTEEEVQKLLKTLPHVIALLR